MAWQWYQNHHLVTFTATLTILCLPVVYGTSIETIGIVWFALVFMEWCGLDAERMTTDPRLALCFFSSLNEALASSVDLCCMVQIFMNLIELFSWNKYCFEVAVALNSCCLWAKSALRPKTKASGKCCTSMNWHLTMYLCCRFWHPWGLSSGLRTQPDKKFPTSLRTQWAMECYSGHMRQNERWGSCCLFKVSGGNPYTVTCHP